MGWGGWGQCTPLTAGPRADAPTSATRGLAIACRPSVRLSVRLVDCDHIGLKSWKLIAQTISPTPSLFAAKRRSTYSQENMGKFFVRLEVG